MFNKVLKKIGTVFAQLPDNRGKSNRTTYRVKDAVLSAFSVFFMQSASFLAHQRDMRRSKGRNNAESLFGVHQVPSDNQIRNLLDPLEPEQLSECFWWAYEELKEAKALEQYAGIDGTLLCAMDGVTYFSSQAISCEKCNRQEHGETITYRHSVIAPVLVAADNPQVVSLEPEFIRPQDGAEKQDCEQNAIKRWIERNAKRFAPHSLTILTDDLHCHQPVIALCEQHKLNFILVCLPTSHLTLYQEIALLDRIDAVQRVVHTFWNGRFHEIWTYRYVNSLSIRLGDDACKVNWCELTIVHKQTGELLYRIAFATNFLLSEQRVVSVVRCGRARWKAENESHNTLKNHGYHLNHNFGHGQQFLASFLLSLNLLAFLIHTVLQLTDPLYQRVRAELGARTTFFDDIRTLTRYLLFDSWDHLLAFMAQQLELSASP
jgi:hypothetical protein